VVTNHLWGRWLREYLPALVQRAKWTQDVPNLKVGDLVIVVDYSTPRGTWPLGRIIEVCRGSDKIVRSENEVWSLQETSNKDCNTRGVIVLLMTNDHGVKMFRLI
jgi:hypothetical protein